MGKKNLWTPQISQKSDHSFSWLRKIVSWKKITVLVKSLKSFWRNQNWSFLKKCLIFFILTSSKNIKIHKAKFEVLLIKIVTLLPKILKFTMPSLRLLLSRLWPVGTSQEILTMALNKEYHMLYFYYFGIYYTD